MHHPKDRITHTTPTKVMRVTEIITSTSWTTRRAHGKLLELIPNRINSVSDHPLSQYMQKLQCILERERNVLFNDALNTFYLRLYGVRHMVKDHSDIEKGKTLPPHWLLID